MFFPTSWNMSTKFSCHLLCSLFSICHDKHQFQQIFLSRWYWSALYKFKTKIQKWVISRAICQTFKGRSTGLYLSIKLRCQLQMEKPKSVLCSIGINCATRFLKHSWYELIINQSIEDTLWKSKLWNPPWTSRIHAPYICLQFKDDWRYDAYLQSNIAVWCTLMCQGCYQGNQCKLYQSTGNADVIPTIWFMQCKFNLELENCSFPPSS